MTKLTQKLDMLRSDGSLKTAIESYQPRGFFDFSATRGGTAEFQLAALIVILELYKHEAPYNNTNRCDGLNICYFELISSLESVITPKLIRANVQKKPQLLVHKF